MRLFCLALWLVIFTRRLISVSAIRCPNAEIFWQKYGVQVTPNNLVAAEAEIMLLAVKPQSLNAAAIGLTSANANCPANCIVSILAGVTLAQLETMFSAKPIIRAMPNTPAQVGAGITAIAANALVTNEQFKSARKFLRRSVLWSKLPNR